MRKFILLFTFTFFWLLTWSCDDEMPSSGSIYGMISDAESTSPIMGAQVILSPGNITAVTGSDGTYEFQNLDAGQYNLMVSASGYNVNNRQVTVVAGESIICDMQLKKEKAMSGIELSTRTLDFGTNYDELTLDIRNTGTSGNIDWYISNITENWLSVSPADGTIEMGKSSSIKVVVDRSYITSSEITTFNVNAAGGSTSVMVSVEPGNGGQGGGDNPGGNDGMSVWSGDYRLSAEVTDCRRNGTQVIFEYTILNEGLGDVDDFRIYPTECEEGSMSLNSAKTVIVDENHKSYLDSDYVFNNKSTDQYWPIITSLPSSVKAEGRIVVHDFESDSKTITIRLGISADIKEELSDPRIYFENIPIE